MRCYYHPEAEAVGTCTQCGKAICQTCAVNVAGRLVCQQDLASGRGTQPLAVPRVPTNPLAIISLALGILGLILCCCAGVYVGIIFGIPAAITGWLARKQIRESGGSQQGMEIATVGLALGGAEVVAAVIALLVLLSLGMSLNLPALYKQLQNP